MKRLLTFLFAASCLTAVGQVPEYVPTDGLVGWWAFDGDALDQSGNENHGVAYGVEFSHDRFGNANMAAMFGMDRWIQIEHSPSIDFVSGDSLTWAIWMKTQPTTAPYGQVIFQKWNGSLGTSYPLSVGCGNQGNLLGSASFCHSDQSLGHDVSTSIGTDTWLHGLMTQTPDSAFLYVNGMLVSASAIAEVGCGNAESLNIGKKLGSIPAFYEGELDDFGLWNRTLSEAEILGLYNTEVQALGCTDQTACNYDPAAIESNGSCDYSCCPGPGCCGEGMFWDWNLGECAITNPSDSNFDGCVQLNDLLDLLSAYGNCGAGESAWQCGEDFEYGGDNYGTIQIGEQCWFSENLRSNYYSNGSLVESIQNNSNWAIGNVGMICTYGNVASNEDLYGSLYNWHAVADVRGLCPTGWHVPEDAEWQGLLGSAGGAAVAGQTLKAQDFWAAGAQGNDALGFDGRPGGYRRYDGTYQTLGSKGYWWTSTAVNEGQATIFELNSTAAVATYPDLINGGFSVRCLKNAE